VTCISSPGRARTKDGPRSVPGLVLIIRVKYDSCFTALALSSRVEYDIGVDESVSRAVVRSVSAVEGQEPLSLPPLATVLDTDALDVLFEPRYDGTSRSGGRLSFIYSNCKVTVDNGEYITLKLLENRLVETSSRDVTDGDSG